MTAAERQARRREKLKTLAKLREADRLALSGRDLRYRPPHGYAQAKEKLIAQRHVFEHARRHFGFEGGVFVDGAFLETHEVIELAKLTTEERRWRLADRRRETKDFACNAIKGYMAALHVTMDELTQSRRPERQVKPQPRQNSAQQAPFPSVGASNLSLTNHRHRLT
jgi:hypothetical protein